MTAEPFDATEIAPMLAYGYDLGGPGHWNMPEGPGDIFPWFNGDEDDFMGQAVRQLDAHRRDPGVGLVGVEIVWYGDAARTDVRPRYLLVAARYGVHYLYAQTLAAGGPYCDPAWDRRLGHALDVLALDPPTAAPRWILAASRGVHS